MKKSLVTLFIFLSLFISRQTFADRYAHPFDANNATTNRYDISRLTCGDFLEMLREKDPDTVNIMIWVHGLFSGFDGGTQPFSKDFLQGSLLIIHNSCDRSPQTPLFTALFTFRSSVKK